MAKAYSIDLRKRVFDFVEAGRAYHQAAAHFSTSVSFVVNLMRLVQETMSLQTCARGGLHHSKHAPHSAFLLAQVAQTPSACEVVILDNLPAHKSKTAEQVVQAKGTSLLFLPPYSPELLIKSEGRLSIQSKWHSQNSMHIGERPQQEQLKRYGRRLAKSAICSRPKNAQNFSKWNLNDGQM